MHEGIMRMENWEWRLFSFSHHENGKLPTKTTNAHIVRECRIENESYLLLGTTGIVD